LIRGHARHANPNRIAAAIAFGEWLAEFRNFVAEREAGRADPCRRSTFCDFPRSSTGMKNGFPTPHHGADNDLRVAAGNPFSSGRMSLGNRKTLSAGMDPSARLAFRNEVSNSASHSPKRELPRHSIRIRIGRA